MAPRYDGVPRDEYLRRCAARRAAMAKRVREGRRVTEVAAEFGANHSVVYDACREHGLTIGRGGNAGYRAALARARRAIAEAVRGGESVSSAARSFGVARSTVLLACREHGFSGGSRRAAGPTAPLAVVLRNGVRRKPSPSRAAALRARRALPRGGRPTGAGRTRLSRWPGHEARIAEVARLLATTELTYAQIGARCGVTRQRVGQVMRGLRGR